MAAEEGLCLSEGKEAGFVVLEVETKEGRQTKGMLREGVVDGQLGQQLSLEGSFPLPVLGTEAEFLASRLGSAHQ